VESTPSVAATLKVVANGRDITYKCRTQSMADWVRELGISLEAKRQRVNRCLQRKWVISLAVSIPVDRMRVGVQNGARATSTTLSPLGVR
jgi:hypothetical protein